jgi:ribonuclease HI
VKTESLICWNLGRGDISFWFDVWYKGIQLGALANSEAVDHKLTVRDALQNPDLWANNMYMHQNTICNILSMQDHIADKDDRPVWKPASSGAFSAKDAWNTVRRHGILFPAAAFLWSSYTPVKWSFTTWRAWMNRMPVDDLMQSRGVALVSKCHCCIAPQIETLDHVFASSQIASQVWKYFGSIFPQDSVHATINVYYMQQWHSPGHKLISSFILCNVFGELWVNRNLGKFEARLGFHHKIIAGIRANIHAVFSSYKKFTGRDVMLLSKFDLQPACFTSVSSIRVVWSPPSQGRMKLNCDGAAKGNPGISAAGCVLRDHEGNVVWALAKFLGMKTNMVAEVSALFYGLVQCTQQQQGSVDIELDSKMLVDMLLHKASVPWQCAHMIHQIQVMLQGMDFSIRHVYREGNRVADCLANVACHAGFSFQVYDSFSIPFACKVLLRHDKLGVPVLRCIKLFVYK